MQDVSLGLLCRLPPPDILIAPRHAASRRPALRQAPVQSIGSAGYGRTVRRSDRIATSCQSSEPAEPVHGRPVPNASGSDSTSSNPQAASRQTIAAQPQSADTEELMKLVAMLPLDMQQKLRSHPDFLQV